MQLLAKFPEVIVLHVSFFILVLTMELFIVFMKIAFSTEKILRVISFFLLVANITVNTYPQN